MDTHTSQRPPVKVKNKAFDFMQFMRLILSGSNCDWRFIINMDQTPVYFTMNAKKTLEVIGKKNHPHSHIDERHHSGRHSSPVYPCVQGEAKWKDHNKGVSIWRLLINPFLQVPGSCLDGRGSTIHCGSSGSRHPHLDP
jgi:hypothetical protein